MESRIKFLLYVNRMVGDLISFGQFYCSPLVMKMALYMELAIKDFLNKTSDICPYCI
jgi:hypothetical protein